MIVHWEHGRVVTACSNFNLSLYLSSCPMHTLNAQSCSHHPPLLPMHNHAVTTLPCSQCTIMQSPPSLAPNAQSCSHHPPMLPMHNHAVTTLPCSQCTIMQSPPSHAPNAQSCSHHPPMLPVQLRLAVPCMTGNPLSICLWACLLCCKQAN